MTGDGITRRRVLQAAGVGVVASAAPAFARFAAALGADGPARPNIVWFRSEDNSADLIGAYGNPLSVTPTIDRLAREGIRFEHFFTTSPVCAPTKLAILTGVHEASLGPGHNMRAQAQLPRWLVGFATYLQRAGYWCTEQGLPKANPDHNTDIGARSGYDDTTGDWRNRPAGKPFFALLGSSTTHETSSFTPVPGPTDPTAVRLPAYHPESPVMRLDRAHYMDQVTRMDREVGQVLADLAADGVLENTIFVYSSDHGGVLPRSKRFCYDSGLRAPLVIRFPRRWRHLAPAPPGSVVDAPISSIDCPPTILRLAGAAVPSYMHGRPFAGGAVTSREFAFSNRNRMDEAIDFVRTARDRRYRYIRNYMPHLPYGQHVTFMWLQAGVRDWEQRFLAGQLDDTRSRFWREKPAEELYDLRSDPDEVRNLAADPAQRPRLERMRAALDEHMLRINDNGFIPEGMRAEGWDASRAPGAYPLRELLELGRTCILRDPRKLAALLTALHHPNEIVRYWGAMGCSMLGGRARPAEAALLRALVDDRSPWVRAQAADALGRAGVTAPAVAHLGGVVADGSAPMSVRLQAVWSLHHLGRAALPALPQLLAAAARTTGLDDYPSQAARYAVRTITGTYVPAP